MIPVVKKIRLVEYSLDYSRETTMTGSRYLICSSLSLEELEEGGKREDMECDTSSSAEYSCKVLEGDSSVVSASTSRGV